MPVFPSKSGVSHVLPPSLLTLRLVLTDQIQSARYGSTKISW